MPIITPHRATIFETIQWAIETTAGQFIDPDKRPLTLQMDMDPMTPSQEVEASGFKGPVDQLMEKDSTEANFKGPLDFNVILYLLSCGLCGVSAKGSNLYTYFPEVIGPEIKLDTMTIQKGSSAGASQFSFASVSDLDIEFGLKGAAIKGKFFGQTMTDGITMFTPVNDIPEQVCSPKLMDVYIADTEAGLAAGHLDKCFKATWGFKNRQRGVMTLDSTFSSYSYTIEDKYSMTAQVTVEQDNTIAAKMFTDLRAANERWCQIVAQGMPIGGTGTTNYSLTLTFPFKFKSSKRQDESGVYSGVYDLLPVYDSTFANPSGGNPGGIIRVDVATDYTDAEL
jgi:hypothetical protein